ncbi:MAG: integrase arm-type DNA-binding domain-containing protein [Gammaproteobacteria bacterium]|nr:integrase arm-type DNA-binding domain-containing protein [Gammaproteobacteria bacterium]MDH4314309.1 integrase arm-type DNA-binding domain-containing protein [Gammaproteobacteria bacterium]MDH5215291.1 integrase arm-type DNA-binding domain-containing protein [Gammaproteobacteria bacterium]
MKVKNARPAAKIRRLFDGAGLYLEISPKGGKWWRYKYRYAGKEKRISLGTYPDVTLKEARDRRYQARKLLDAYIDPSEHRQIIQSQLVTSATNTFEIVAREWFAQRELTWARNHSSRIIGRLENDIFPWIGKKPIDSITPPQLLEVVRRIEGRGVLETAHRALATCGQVFRYAVATSRADRDATADLRGALPPIKRNHFAAFTEPADVAILLRQVHGYSGSVVVRCAIQLAPLVFVRPGELRQAKWADFDLDAAEWRFTVSKTNTPHIVPLARQAVAILQEIQPLTGRGVYVFPSARSAKGIRPMSDNAILAAMRSMGIGKDQMSGHGFRAMARTMLDEILGYRPELIEQQLAHQVRDPNGRAYNRTKHLDERTKLMQDWADYLEALRLGVEQGRKPTSATSAQEQSAAQRSM